MTNNHHPIALTIAGSDSSAGAGMQADLKTFLQHKVHGLSAVTSIVAETPLEVRQISPTPVTLLQDQIQLLLQTYPVDVIKIGLLPTRAIVIAVAEILKNSSIPSIIDPVMTASTGNNLSDNEAAQTLKERLLNKATLITPNIPEASAILDRKIKTEADLESAAKEISDTYKASCLLKGGHLENNTEKLDLLWHKGKAHHFRHPSINLPQGMHGTGCTLSSAIAARLAQKHPLEQAVESGIDYVQKLIHNAYTWKNGGKTIHSLGW